MTDKSSLSAVAFVDIDSLVAVVCIQGREDASFSHQVDTFVRLQRRIRVPDGYRIQLSIVDTTSERTVFSRGGDNWGCPLGCAGFDDVSL